MIGIESARSGHLIVKKHGRLLASSFDPVKEASVWATKVVETASAHDSVFVLGAGSGHHVVELMNRRPDTGITVIECDQEVATAALRICPALSSPSSNAQIVVESDWTKLTEHGAFRDALGACYTIATHMPSRQAEPEYFGRVERLLLGRDKTSFLLQLRARPEMFALFDPAGLERLGDELISIKTLQKIFAPQSLSAHERRVWKALEELIT